MRGHEPRMKEMRNGHNILVGNPASGTATIQDKRPLPISNILIKLGCHFYLILFNHQILTFNRFSFYHKLFEISRTKLKIEITIQIIILLVYVKKWTHFNNTMTIQVIYKNHLMMTLIDRNMSWDGNKISRILDILISVYNQSLC